MKKPHTFDRRILLAVTGLSPQVVTETLYALTIIGEPAFVPTEIHLLTTVEGASQARNSLLHPDKGYFHCLLADYPQLGRPAFDEKHIHIICDDEGRALSDIRTPGENACAADTITALVAELTRDDNAALHVSIAGGRKTMGFYLGYAFSLYAREQDRLSHVLVSAPFESHPDFFYPPATPRRLTTRDGRHHDTAHAQITLAEIPIVRLRHGLPEELQQRRASFNETVAALQESFAPPRLTIDFNKRQVICGQQALKLSPILFAWLAWWAIHARQGCPMQGYREADVDLFLRLYEPLAGRDSVALEKTRKRLGDGMEKEFFQENNSKINRAMRDKLGPAAKHYELAPGGKRGGRLRGLRLSPESIRLLDLPENTLKPV